MKKKPYWAVFYGLGLTAFTVYVVLRVFVIREAINTNATEMNTSMFDNITQALPSWAVKPETEEVTTEDGPVPTEDVPKTDELTCTPTPGMTITCMPEPTKTVTPEPTATVTPKPMETISPKPTATVTLKPTATNTPKPVATNTPKPTATPTATPTPMPKKQETTTESTIIRATPVFSSTEVITENTYSNDHIYIEIHTYREHNTDIHIAEVFVTSAQYIKTAFAEDTYGRNVFETTSSMAARKGAIFAINGDDYGAREGGYVIRNGVLYRDAGNTKRKTLSLLANGEFMVTAYNEMYPNELLKKGAWQAWTFGPLLVNNGKIIVDVDEEVDYSSRRGNQRTAIGIVEPLHYVFLCSDGRMSNNVGISLYQVADIMARYGCTMVYNTDGGGSATMVFNGKFVNYPTDWGTSMAEREVSDIIYVQ